MSAPNLIMHPVTSSLEEKDIVQHHLILLLHAMKCARRANSHECPLPLCSTMKTVLEHITHCENQTDCQYHYQSCKKEDCSICKEVRRERLKEVYPPDFPTASSSSSTTTAQSPVRSWQSEVSINVRDYLVNKLEKDLSKAAIADCARQVAERIERESYANAQSKNEYFMELATRVYTAVRQKSPPPSLEVSSEVKHSKLKRVGQKARLVERRSSLSSECVICLENFRDSRRRKEKLNCNHVFHTTCIKKWLSRSPACPLCRAPKS